MCQPFAQKDCRVLPNMHWHVELFCHDTCVSTEHGISHRLLVGHLSLRGFVGGAQCSSWGRIVGLWRLLRCPWHGVDLRHCSQSTGFRAEGQSPSSKMRDLHILCKGIHVLGVRRAQVRDIQSRKTCP